MSDIIRAPHDASAQRTLNPLERARRVVELWAERGAADVALLDLRGLTIIADYFVVCTAGSTVQMRAIRDALDREPVPPSASHPKFEGEVTDGWLLADFGGVVVHVFAPEARSYYRLDELWSDAPVVARLQ